MKILCPRALISIRTPGKSCEAMYTVFYFKKYMPVSCSYLASLEDLNTLRYAKWPRNNFYCRSLEPFYAMNRDAQLM